MQYAHARSRNVQRNADAAGLTIDGADLALLDTRADGEVLAVLSQWPSVLILAGSSRGPHHVAHYLEELASAYHKWYALERVVPASGDSDRARAAARLKLNNAVSLVIASGLGLLNVTAPDTM